MRRQSPKALGVVLVGTLTLAVLVAGDGRSSAASAPVTITLIDQALTEPGLSVMIANFERVDPNITVEPTYVASSPDLDQLELTELAAGNAPDVLSTEPGCGTSVSICVLAAAGDLAPMLDVPWAKRSMRLVTSLDKYGKGLFAFTPDLSLEGVFANDADFTRLGLTVPQTFAQLLQVCQKAAAAGTPALVLPGAAANAPGVSNLITDLAVATVYGPDPGWTAALKAGTSAFDGTAGWHAALQEFVDMSTAGCFEPGMTGTTLNAATAEFAQGEGLMLVGLSSFKGTLDALDPQFTYSFHPFPGASAPDQTATFVDVGGNSLSVNADSSPQRRAAAQAFINFTARPQQNALYAQIQGGLTQYEFIKRTIPAFMSAAAPVIDRHEYVVAPYQGWWNADVLLSLQQTEIGLVTGQTTIDGVLNAMDAAWKQGPA